MGPKVETVAVERQPLNLALDFLALTRPRVLFMVVVTTFVGFYLGSRGVPDWIRLLQTLLAMILSVGGTLALNQYLERDVDKRMERTCLRPLPDGRLRPGEVLIFGGIITALGLLCFVCTVGVLSAGMTVLAITSYLFLYTPLKRKSPFSTLVGAVPGALPPVVGWVAARGELDLGAWILFGILFLWQIPHSLAIATLYRDDYARAGIRLLPVVEEGGGATGRQIVTFSLALLTVGLLPTTVGLAGLIYFTGAFLLGIGHLSCGIGLAFFPSAKTARCLLHASLIYLPALLLLLVLDKVPV